METTVYRNNITKTVPAGFSWTTLFFWFIPAFVRGDYKWSAIMFVLSIFTSGLSILVFPFVYNDIFLNRLRAQGWVAQGDTPEDLQRAIQKEKTSFWVSMAVIVFMIVLVIMAPSKKSNPVSEQQAREEAAERKVSKFNDDGRLFISQQVRRTIREGARNPDSVEFDQIGINEDGSVICVEFRAENGFGGMNLEQVMYLDGKPKTDSTSWNKHCTNAKLYSMPTY